MSCPAIVQSVASITDNQREIYEIKEVAEEGTIPDEDNGKEQPAVIVPQQAVKTGFSRFTSKIFKSIDSNKENYKTPALNKKVSV